MRSQLSNGDSNFFWVFQHSSSESEGEGNDNKKSQNSGTSTPPYLESDADDNTSVNFNKIMANRLKYTDRPPLKIITNNQQGENVDLFLHV